jgi:hypothetical protein
MTLCCFSWAREMGNLPLSVNPTAHPIEGVLVRHAGGWPAPRRGDSDRHSPGSAVGKVAMTGRQATQGGREPENPVWCPQAAWAAHGLQRPSA